MKPTLIFSLLAAALLALVAYSGMRREPAPAPVVVYPPGREPMVLPQNYRDNFDLYAVVDRSDDITRHIYISPAAVDAVRAGQDFPERTQIVIEAYDAARDLVGNVSRDDHGRLVAGVLEPEIHVAELRSTWFIEDLASSAHVGDWNFDAFDSATGVSNHDARNECFSCHDGADRTEFLFSRNLLARYAQTGETQYAYCPAPKRVPCGF